MVLHSVRSFTVIIASSVLAVEVCTNYFCVLIPRMLKTRTLPARDHTSSRASYHYCVAKLLLELAQ